MTKGTLDLEKVRVALQRLSRGNLLIIAGRATELVARAKLPELVGDFVRLDEMAKTEPGAASLLAEVRAFSVASLRGDYYEDFSVDSKNFMARSEGTETFIAEFERLARRCIRAAAKGPRSPVREAFELLFALLLRIDEGEDDVIFFADEGGSWEMDVDWREVLPAYFACLAESAAPADYAREVDRVIKEFADYERPRHLAAARKAANAEQKAALRSLASHSPLPKAPRAKPLKKQAAPAKK